MTETGTRTPAEGVDAFAFSPFDPALRADPYPTYRRLRETAPRYHNQHGLWVLSRHRDCAAVLRDPRFGHGDGGLGPLGMPGRRGIPIDQEEAARSFLRLDPPDHTRLRGLVSKAFTPKVVEGLQPRIRQLVDELLDAALEAGTVDLIEALAYPLPVIVICELLGVPRGDHETFKGWSRDLARGLDPEFTLTPEQLERRDAAAIEFGEYFRGLLDERRRRPCGDLLSKLVRVDDDGERLTELELLTTCVLLLVAGHETTVNLIGNGTLALLRHPDQLARLRDDPRVAATAVDELLRFDPPVQLTARLALQDVQLGDDQVRRGDLLVLLIGAANRDPEVFDDPDRLDLGRAGARHLAFGLGIHFCLGAPLARLEGQLALGALVRRAPGLAPTGEPLRYKDNAILRGLAALPVTLRG